MASTVSDAEILALRDQLVEHLSANRLIESAAVAQAFRAVPRHLFLPDIDPAAVYTDEAIPTKRGEHGIPISSSSQPAIMAVMLEQLGVESGHHILEIGAGTGYNAALLDQLVGPTGSVTTVDIDEDLVVSAREHLAAAHASQVEVVHGDGGLGWPDCAPYDRIVVTAGAWDIPPAWTEQLAPHGRLVLPLSLRTIQQSVAFEPVADHLTSVSIRPCGFMPMRGAFARPPTIVALDADAGLFLDVAVLRDVDIPALCTAVRNGGKDIPSGIQASKEDLWGLRLWLTLHELDMCQLYASGAAADQGLVPALITRPALALAVTAALLGDNSLAALVRLDGDGSERSELGVRPLGGNATPLAQRLLAQIRRWEAQGPPSASRLNISTYPLRETSTPAGGTIIDKPSRRLALTWQPATSSAGDSPRPHGQ